MPNAKDLVNLGFTAEQAAEILRMQPKASTISSKKTVAAMEYLQTLGFTGFQTREILVGCPSIMGKRIQTIECQIGLLKEIFPRGNHLLVILRNPRRLIQGCEETRKRWKVLAQRGLDQQRLEKEMFLTRNTFWRRYGGKLGGPT